MELLPNLCMSGPSERHDTAFVAICCESGGESYVANELKSIPEITEVECTVGRYDIITKIRFGSIESLRDLLTFKIRKIPQITSTTTLMCTTEEIPLIQYR